MIESFQSLGLAQQIFWCVGIVAGIVFIIQSILTFIGLDSDADAGFDGVEMDGVTGFFSFKNLINFLLGYGWGGVCLSNAVPSPVGLQLAAIGVGLAFVCLFLLVLRQVLRLGVDKTFHVEDAVGHTADVYLRIPAARGGSGKVQVSVNGSVHELEAMTDGDAIPTGAKAKVVGTITSDSVLVERI